MNESSYLIPVLPFAQLDALQKAIAAGALSAQIRSLQLAVEANKGHSSIQEQFLRELEALQAAGRAIMNAIPMHGTMGQRAVEAARNLCASHHVFGFGTSSFNVAYLHLAKVVNYNWELLEGDMPTPVADRGRSLT